MMPEQQQRILGYFIEEAKDHLNTIEQGLLNLQATIEDAEMANEVFRAAHSVKGGAAMLGIGSVQRTAHRMEDFFKILKESPGTQIDRGLESMFLQVFDGLQALIEELQGPFGLTEDKAQEVMTDLEPVFGKVEQHLNALVASAGSAAPAAPIPAPAAPVQRAAKSAATSEESALKLVFKSDVPGHLREMLTLFKQADNQSSRSALQSCCDALKQIGEQFELGEWCELTAATRAAVGNSDHTYRALAPIVIKELKKAQEQVLTGQRGAIAISSELADLVPPPAAPAAEDIDSLLDDALADDAEETDLADLFESESQSIAAESDLDADMDWMDGSADAAETAAPATNLEAPSELAEPQASVGAAELNSLADLFEGEVSGLESPWEEVSESESAMVDNSGPDIDISPDFSDLLEDPTEDTDHTQQDLADLFGAEGLSTDAAMDLGNEVAGDEDDFADLFDLSSDAAASTPSSQAETTQSVDEDQGLDDLLDSMSDEGTTSPPAELDAQRQEEAPPDMAAALNDLGDLFADGGNLDLATDLADAIKAEHGAAGMVVEADSAGYDLDFDLTPSATVLATPSDAVRLDDSNDVTEDLWGSSDTEPTESVAASSNPVDESAIAFDEISDPWSSTELDVSEDDDSALDALDELWSESHEEPEPVAATATESVDDEFAEFADLDFPDDDSTETSEAIDFGALLDDDADFEDAASLNSSEADLEAGNQASVTTTDAEAFDSSDMDALFGDELAAEASSSDDSDAMPDLDDWMSDIDGETETAEAAAGEDAEFSLFGEDEGASISVDDLEEALEFSQSDTVLEVGTDEADAGLDESDFDDVLMSEIPSPDSEVAETEFEEGQTAAEAEFGDLFGATDAAEPAWAAANGADDETDDGDFDLMFSEETSPADLETAGADLDELLETQSGDAAIAATESAMDMDFFGAEPDAQVNAPDGDATDDFDFDFGDELETSEDAAAIAAADSETDGLDDFFSESAHPEQTETDWDALLSDEAADDGGDMAELLEGDDADADDTDFPDLLKMDDGDAEMPMTVADTDDDLTDLDFSDQPEDHDLMADDEATGGDDLDDLDALLAADTPSVDAALETPVVDDDVEATAAATETDFDDLDALLDDDDAAEAEGGDVAFDELDSLLDEEPVTEDSSSEFDDLDALLDDDGEADDVAAEGGDADFDELEALLDDDDRGGGADADDDDDATDEFGDLEKLLEEADRLGGSSPTIRSASVGRPPRRVGAMVDQTMRVSVRHLDNLNNLVGELVVNRNSLEQDQERLRQFLDNLMFQVQQLNDVGQRMRDLYERSLLESSLISSRQAMQGAGMIRGSNGHSGNGGASHSTGATFDALEMDRFTGFHTLSQEMIELIVRVRESASDIAYTVESSDQITRQFRQVTTQLQEGLNKARMVPFAQTADRLPRAVRDISLKCGKEARLVVEGRDTLIDKMILERLYDPMTHLVNNAITHGVETPDERAAIGKSREGTITIRAFYQGNQTVIYIADDGAGINPEMVKRKAIKKGLITQAEADSMTVLETYELLFRPGFSTRDKADDFAGRGVGMDVVRTALSEIRGSITIDSEMGRGTSFTIRLPLTLSISKALSCLNNQARIAFPMDGVEDMFDVPKERVQVDEDGHSSIQWRDSMLSFQALSELLQFNRSLGRGRVYGGNQDEDMVSIVVLRSANTYIGVQVDRVLGEQEIVIKQIEGPVPKPMGIAGATVLGDGRVMPIADVLELIDIAQGRVRREAGSSLWSQAEEPPEEEVVEVKAEPTVLIVDDSITVRELLSMSFNKVGYRVEQARDGQEAWEKLRSGLPCDLVFCDIEMPRMDGLELLSRMQKDGLLKRVPIAMLTSRGADRHRQMALDLGASGYFTKPYLEEALLDAAQRMLNGEVLLTKVTAEEESE